MTPCRVNRSPRALRNAWSGVALPSSSNHCRRLRLVRVHRGTARSLRPLPKSWTTVAVPKRTWERCNAVSSEIRARCYSGDGLTDPRHHVSASTCPAAVAKRVVQEQQNALLGLVVQRRARHRRAGETLSVSTGAVQEQCDARRRCGGRRRGGARAPCRARPRLPGASGSPPRRSSRHRGARPEWPGRASRDSACGSAKHRGR